MILQPGDHFADKPRPVLDRARRAQPNRAGDRRGLPGRERRAESPAERMVNALRGASFKINPNANGIARFGKTARTEGVPLFVDEPWVRSLRLERFG
jgi:hypothetical protein